MLFSLCVLLRKLQGPISYDDGFKHLLLGVGLDIRGVSSKPIKFRPKFSREVVSSHCEKFKSGTLIFGNDMSVVDILTSG